MCFGLFVCLHFAFLYPYLTGRAFNHLMLIMLVVFKFLLFVEMVVFPCFFTKGFTIFLTVCSFAFKTQITLGSSITKTNWCSKHLTFGTLLFF